MNKLEKFKIKISSAELLKFLKSNYSYRELSKMFGLSTPILSRYVNGYVLPNLKRAERILEISKRDFLKKMIKAKIKFKKDDIYDLSPLISDIKLQKMIGKIVFNEFSSQRIDKILTAEAGGVPLAVQIGNEFGVNVLAAKKEKEIGVEEFIEGKCMFSPAAISYLYLPEQTLKKDELILLVDDLIRTGTTMAALVNMVKKARAKIGGIFTIISTGKVIEKLKKELNLECKISQLLKI